MQSKSDGRILVFCMGAATGASVWLANGLWGPQAGFDGRRIVLAGAAALAGALAALGIQRLRSVAGRPR
jgi:hypothetical protein